MISRLTVSIGWMSGKEKVMNRNLDRYYFRVKRDGKWDNICWSDMTDEERDEQMTNRSEEWLKSLCKGLGNVIHKIGEDLDIACE